MGASTAAALFLLLLGCARALRIGSSATWPELSDEETNLRKRADPEVVYGKEHRDLMLRGCGEVCDETILGTPGKFFNEVRKTVDCMALYANMDNDAPGKAWPPPRNIPRAFQRDFDGNGTVRVRDKYMQVDYSHEGMRNSVWTKAQIDELIRLAGLEEVNGTYGRETTSNVRRLLQRHKTSIRGKHFFTIGSERPWLEALLLEAGAGHVTTIEYGAIRSEDPRVTTVVPSAVREQFLSSGGREPRFDGGATFSSVEHSGLGRYGETLNPWGDLQAMAKAWCITKPGGGMFAGVPTGGDNVWFNAHRQYGSKRWPQLMANWHQVDSYSPNSEEDRKQPGWRFPTGKEQSASGHMIFFTRMS